MVTAAIFLVSFVVVCAALFIIDLFVQAVWVLLRCIFRSFK